MNLANIIILVFSISLFMTGSIWLLVYCIRDKRGNNE